MSANTERALLSCPRCGADIADPEAGHCTCCGASLGMGGRNGSGERTPLRMSSGLGQEIGAARAQPRPQAQVQAQPQASARAPETRGFDSVRRHPQFDLWMQDAPTGLAHVLGLAGMMAMGLLFAVLALSGSIHTRGGNGGELFVALFVCVGLGIDAWGAWRLVRFFQAPRLNRIARVAHEREHTYRTKHGWRTRHYATFEFEDGERLEFPVSSSRAAQLTRGDCGVAITRDTVLLAFHSA